MSRLRQAGIAVALVVVSSALTLLLAEGVLRALVHPGDFMPAEMSHDPILRHRVKPLTTLHDELGFRNSEVPKQVDILAIGDSFTYGNAAFRDQSWPHQLGKLLGEPVYNMGMGGYGPLQYLYLAQNQAKSLKPRLIVLGLYLGNDALDAYYLAHTNTHWRGWRESVADASLDDTRAMTPQPPARFEPIRRWLSRNSTLYWVIRGVRLRLSMQDERHLGPAPAADVQWAWRDPIDESVRTLFTPAFTLQHVSLSDPKVSEGLSITSRALAALRDEAVAQGAALMVVVMPSKEFAYCRYLKATGAGIPQTHSRVCDNESQLHTQVLLGLGRLGLPVVDTLGAIELAIDRHERLYPLSNDSHFAAPGYRLVAEQVASAIRAARERRERTTLGRQE